MRYRIIAACDPYNTKNNYNGQPVVKYDGNTPTRWIMESGLSLEKAKETLWDYACQDMDRHSSNLSFEDEDNIRDFAQEIADDQEISIEEAMSMFDWFKGEGIYYSESHDPMYLKGGDSYSYDVMTYMLEEEK